MSELTQLFVAIGGGDRAAVERLMALLYDDLHRLAHRRLAAGPAQPLQTTELVHESYLRFLRTGALEVADRSHFLAYASRVMRSIIVDLMRRQYAERRGGGALAVTLDTRVAESLTGTDADVLRIHEVLEELAGAEPRLVQVVEMRYFAGLDEAEIAGALGITERTVRRDWQKARILLRAALA